MRCVQKGIAPKAYSNHRAFRNDLAGRIGWYCSYCEMPVKNMIEIEHVHPTANGGAELDWDNFLLSCRYCNGVKAARNTNRIGYLWPDRDNTIVAFEYSELKVIEPMPGLPAPITKMALDTIDLMGLNRAPNLVNEPNDADSRWIYRETAIGIIKESYSDWLLLPHPPMARQIARTATGHGYYSFWIKQFSGVPQVLNEINAAFKNAYVPTTDSGGNYALRANGVF